MTAVNWNLIRLARCVKNKTAVELIEAKRSQLLLCFYLCTFENLVQISSKVLLNVHLSGMLLQLLWGTCYSPTYLYFLLFLCHKYNFLEYYLLTFFAPQKIVWAPTVKLIENNDSFQ